MNDAASDADAEQLEDEEYPDVEDDGVIVDLDPNSEANKGFGGSSARSGA